MAAPTAQLYDFTSIASGARTASGYTSFTDVGTEESYFAVEEHPVLTLQAALSAALLAAVIMVASWEIWALARARRRRTVALGT